LKYLLASSEIGIVVSMKVTLGSGGIPFGLAGGSSGCLAVDTVHEVPCGTPGYNPYAPDTLQAIYLVTNTGTATASNVRVVVPGPVPRGVSVVATTRPVVPGTLAANLTGVATISVVATPRLQSQSYTIPITVVANASDTVIHDELNVCVPGLLGAIRLNDALFPPVCPNRADTIDAELELEGARCLPITALELLGSAPAINNFSLVPPLPAIVPADGKVKVRIRYQPTAVTPVESVRLAVAVRDFESLLPGDTTFAFVRDTATITGVGKEAEFSFAQTTDTLDFGAVCVGDTTTEDWQVRNVGGCTLDLTNYRVAIEPGAFDLVTPALSPANSVTIDRGGLKPLTIRFNPTSPGAHQALLILEGDAFPFRDTLVVRGRGDIPGYTLTAQPIVFDTICPGSPRSLPLTLTNPTACPVLIDSLVPPGAEFSVAPSRGFTIPPFSSVNVQVLASAPATPGTYGGDLAVRSNEAGDRSVKITAVVASRALQTAPRIDFGDVRVRRSGQMPLVIRSTGDAGVEIARIYLAGTNTSEFTLTYPPGTSFPLYLPPGASLAVQVDFAPSDIDARRAVVAVETTPGKACSTLDPIALEGRGVLPIIDVPRRSLDFGRVCVGASVDTAIAVRNLGNAALTIDALTISGSADLQAVEGMPVTVAAGEERSVRVRFTPTLLGTIATELKIGSDGDWFTAPDTLVRLTGTGSLCGTLSVDTVHALVGDIVKIPIRFTPRAGLDLKRADVADLMNRSGRRSFTIMVGNSIRNLRFQGIADTAGMVSGLTVPPQATITPTSILLASDDSHGDLRSSDLLGVLRGDVLLGDGSRTPLPLDVQEFAGGYADLDLHDGLLVADYCAIDKRYLDVSGAKPFSRPSQMPLPATGMIEFYLPAAAEASLKLIDPLGRTVGVLFNGTAEKGLHAVGLPTEGVASGMYTLLLETGGGEYVTQVVVVR
jgi:hypothetical protein